MTFFDFRPRRENLPSKELFLAAGIFCVAEFATSSADEGEKAKKAAAARSNTWCEKAAASIPSESYCFFSSSMRSEDVSHSAADSMSGHAARTSRKRARESGDVVRKQALFSTVHPVFEKKEGGFSEGLAEN